MRPSAFSRLLICWLTADCVMCSSWAAAVKLRARAEASKARSQSSPVGVSAIDLPTRSNRVTPMLCSMAATWRLSVGWVKPSLRAAADSEPVSAVSRNAFS